MSDDDFSAIEENIDCDNSIGWHLYLITKNKDLLKGCNDVMYECFLDEEINTRKRKEAVRKIIRRLVISLYKVYEVDPTKYITVSLNNNDWSGKGRYSQLGLSAKRIRVVIDHLHEKGLIELIVGDVGWNPKDRKQTRIRALPRLIEIVNQTQVQGDVLKAQIQLDKKKYLVDDNRPRIILRDKDKNSIHIPRLPNHIAQGKRLLEKYQEILDGTLIISPKQGEIEAYEKFQYRIFSNGRFDHNGRVHGGFWQTIDSELRPYIVLDGQATVEQDIKATFPVIVYHFLGIDYWQQYRDLPWEENYKADPYYLEGYTDTEPFGKDYRNTLKIIFNSAINSENTGKNLGWLTTVARARLQERLNANPPKLSREAVEIISPQLPKLINRFIREKHHLLKDHLFFKELGMEAMYAESLVAMGVIGEFVLHRKPVLTIYDSFIVKEEDGNLLSEVIINAYFNVMGFLPFITPK